MVDRRRLAVAAIAVAACTGLAFTAISAPLPRLVWNASASAPIGLYRTIPGVPVRPGDLVIARLPAAMRLLAARRHYLPLGVPLVKRVVAVSGDRICATGSDIVVNGKPGARRAASDQLGRPLPIWPGCRTLRRGDVFLLMTTVADSFDGRYFGPTARDDVIARAVPLWVR